jgi:large subunit ribosomal protein L35
MKLKTRKAALKRYKKTKLGNFICKHPGKGHLLMKKSNRQKRRLSVNIFIAKKNSKILNLMLPY